MHVELAPHGVKVATLNPGSYRTVLMNECLKPNRVGDRKSNSAPVKAIKNIDENNLQIGPIKGSR
jgi:short-subunit dehydrogenase